MSLPISSIIAGSDFGSTHNDAVIFEHLDRIHDMLLEILERGDTEGAATNFLADQMAKERFRVAWTNFFPVSENLFIRGLRILTQINAHLPCN